MRAKDAALKITQVCQRARQVWADAVYMTQRLEGPGRYKQRGMFVVMVDGDVVLLSF